MRWSIAAAAALGLAVPLAILVYPVIGSGRRCEGIGFGCTPEREADTLLVVAVYAVTALGTLLFARRHERRGGPWRPVLAAGAAITVLATATAVWAQLPRHPVSSGPLSAALERWERVLSDGAAVAQPGTPLTDALEGLRRRGPLTCRDAYGRSTGARRFQWSDREGRTYAGRSHSSRAASAAALGRWARRLRGRGEAVEVSDPSGDPTSDRRLQVGGYGAAAGGVLYVRASFYATGLEITAATGCHKT